MSDPRLSNERESLKHVISQRDERITELEEALKQIRSRARKLYDRVYEDMADSALKRRGV